VQAVCSLVNPDKLGHLGLPVADAKAMLRGVSARRRGG
jgi:hypothetical protein